MYKSKLQELCQEKQWTLPTYSSIREGADHCPSFKAKVVVNGVSFDGHDSCKSSKEAQSEAARIAYNHLVPPAVVSPSPTPIATTSLPASSSPLSSSLQDMQHLYKGRLQNFARKSGFNLPVYSCVREGPSHAVRFKAIVTVDGKTFESPEFFHTLKEAEHAAAKSALSSLLKDGNQEEDCFLYKNLLQELTHKEGFSIPVYKTTKSGASHAPTFSSTVEIEGDVFNGTEAKSKKQAELSAAKVAFLSLKQRQSANLPQSGIPAHSLENSQAQDATKCINFSLAPVVAVDPEPSLKSIEISVSTLSINSEESTDGDQSGNSVEITTRAVKSSGDSVHSPPKQPTPPENVGQPTTVSQSSSNLVENSGSDVPVPISIICERVRLLPHKPNMTVPEGFSLLPVGDDKWIAVSFEFNNQNGN